MQTTGSLYFHLPFCQKKCPYCHFFVVKDTENAKEALFFALQQELLWWKPIFSQWDLVSVYFGGGTPSLFGPGRIANLLDSIGQPIQEITLEANPEDITAAKMAEYRLAGVNRVSIGVQSFEDSLLKSLQRGHSAKRAKQAIEEVFQSGIDNISIDLMYDIPEQTLAQWKSTLFTVHTVPITHLSIYNLTLEPGTPFGKKSDILAKKQPSEALSQQMYEACQQNLSHFVQYEISAFAQEGFESIHNKGYWQARPFIGFGPSAFSYYKGWRFSNARSMKTYIEATKKGFSPVDFREKLCPEGRTRELLAVGIRLKEGVKKPLLMSKELSLQIKKLQNQELIIEKGKRLFLTPKGVLLYDSVASFLIL